MEGDMSNLIGGPAFFSAPVADMWNGPNSRLIGHGRQSRTDGSGYGVMPEIGPVTNDFRPAVAA